MANLKITPALAEQFLKARGLGAYDKKMERRRLMKEVRKMFPAISRSTRLRIAVENPGNPNYLILRDKRTHDPLDDGQPTPSTPVSTPASTPAKQAKTIAKAAIAKAKAPAVKSKAKVPAKVVVKAAKKPAKPAPVKAKAPAKAVGKAKSPKLVKALAIQSAPAKSAKPVKVAEIHEGYPKKIRVMHQGKRISLGNATSPKHEKLLRKKALVTA